METRLLKIVLWARDPNLGIRPLEFSQSGINVITGWSLTGKSALIPIIDYCLGSHNCTIPVGVIRQTVSWFGVYFRVGSWQILSARREPGSSGVSEEMMFLEGSDVKIPDTPSSNSSAATVRERLNRLYGVPDLDFGPGENGYHKDRPSFRDMMAFVFQPQHLIANPFTLYYKADSTEHREKLKTIFPLVLGAITPEHLALRRRLSDLERELDVKREELRNVVRAAEVWLSQAQTQYLEAKELGLISEGAPSHLSSLEDYIAALSELPARRIERVFPNSGLDKTSEAVHEITSLRGEEQETAARIASLRRKLLAFEDLSETTRQYGHALTVKSERLSGVGWLRNQLIRQKSVCPLCGSHFVEPRAEMEQLNRSVTEISTVSQAVGAVPEVFSKEMEDVRKELRVLEHRLDLVRRQRIALEQESEEVAQSRQMMTSVFRFLGRLEQSLSNYRLAQGGGKLKGDVEGLENQVADLRKLLDSQEEKRRLDDILARVSVLAQPYLEVLGVERPFDPIRVDIRNLSLRILTGDRHHPYLWEVGSGANWLGYHIAVLLALHEHFLSMQASSVPSILVLDQPSQVYFPDKWPTDPLSKLGRGRSEGQASDDWLMNEWGEDIGGVHRVFAALALAVRRTAGRLQVMVIEHADEITWMGIDGISVVERWRESGEKLVPQNWIKPVS